MITDAKSEKTTRTPIAASSGDQVERMADIIDASFTNRLGSGGKTVIPILEKIEKNTALLKKLMYAGMKVAKGAAGRSMAAAGKRIPERDARGRFVSANTVASITAMDKSHQKTAAKAAATAPLSSRKAIAAPIDALESTSSIPATAKPDRAKKAEGRDPVDATSKGAGAVPVEFKSAEAAKSKREQRNAKVASDAMSTGLLSHLKKLGGGAKAVAKDVGEKKNLKDTLGSALGGPIWEAAKEMKEVADEIGDALNKRKKKKEDAGAEAKKAEARSSKKRGRPRKTPADDTPATLKDLAKDEDTRHRQLLKAVKDISGDDMDLPFRRKKRGGGGPDIDIDRNSKKGKKGAKASKASKKPGRVKNALKSGKTKFAKAGRATGRGLSKAGKAGGRGLAKVGKGALKLGKFAAGGLMGSAGMVAAAGAAGYGAGTLINKGIGKLTGRGDGWLGDIANEKMDKGRKKKQEQEQSEKYDKKKKNFSPEAVEMMGGEKGFDIKKLLPLLQSGKLVKREGMILTADEDAPEIAKQVKSPEELASEQAKLSAPEASQATPVTTNPDRTQPMDAKPGAPNTTAPGASKPPVATPGVSRPPTPERIGGAAPPAGGAQAGADRSIVGPLERMISLLEKYLSGKDGGAGGTGGAKSTGNETPAIRDNFDDTTLNLIAHDRL